MRVICDVRREKTALPCAPAFEHRCGGKEEAPLTSQAQCIRTLPSGERIHER